MPTCTHRPAPHPSPSGHPAAASAPEALRVAVVGSGYVGLVSGGCLASLGHQVCCVDNDSRRIDALSGGDVPFYEPGLRELVAHQVRSEPGRPSRLSFSTRVADVATWADIVIIAVGTPLTRDGAHADLTHVHAAVEIAARHMRDRTALVIKSTAPVGTGDDIQRRVKRLRPEASIAVISNPEFLREGKAIQDFCRPARVIIGNDTSSSHGTALMQRLYAVLKSEGTPIVLTSRRTAELIKYASNSFLATKLAFINEMADLCEEIGADVDDVALGMGLDPRIGADYLRAGPGFGGSCLPKDLVALARTARDNDTRLHLVEAVSTLHAQRQDRMLSKVAAACGGSVQGKTVAILGVAFKPDTDDVRAAPALALAAALRAAGAAIRLSDPQALHHARSLFPDAACVDDPYECAKGSDAIVVVTEWRQYRDLDLLRLRAGMRTPNLIDLRNIYLPEAARAAGFAYTGVGRGRAASAAISRNAVEEAIP